jgi:hypothetical protein
MLFRGAAAVYLTGACLDTLHAEKPNKHTIIMASDHKLRYIQTPAYLSASLRNLKNDIVTLQLKLLHLTAAQLCGILVCFSRLHPTVHCALSMTQFPAWSPSAVSC